MVKISTIIIIVLCSVYCKLDVSAQSKLDSSFTLAKFIRQDRLNISQHRVYFNETINQVLKDFDTMERLGLTDLRNYQKQIIKDGNHVVKIWNAKKGEDLSRITDINSVYAIDTTEEGRRFKAIVAYNDYYIQFKDTSKNVFYETIEKQGVNKYSIGNRKVFAQREMVLVALFYVDHTKQIKRVLDKYN